MRVCTCRCWHDFAVRQFAANVTAYVLLAQQSTVSEYAAIFICQLGMDNLRIGTSCCSFSYPIRFVEKHAILNGSQCVRSRRGDQQVDISASRSDNADRNMFAYACANYENTHHQPLPADCAASKPASQLLAVTDCVTDVLGDVNTHPSVLLRSLRCHYLRLRQVPGWCCLLRTVPRRAVPLKVLYLAYLDPCDLLVPVSIVVVVRGICYIYTTSFPLWHLAITLERCWATLRPSTYEHATAIYAHVCSVVVVWSTKCCGRERSQFSGPSLYGIRHTVFYWLTKTKASEIALCT